MIIKILSIIAVSFLSVSIYSISATDIDGNQLIFSTYQGKKILIVNTASNSQYASQYAELEELYQRYKDSLVVIAFPSNSFGNEPLSNSAIKDFIHSNYDTHFILGEKVNVTGADQAPIYSWLTQFELNGMMGSPIRSDFQKYLVESDGKLIGVFSGIVSPMDSSIQKAIIGN